MYTELAFPWMRFGPNNQLVILSLVYEAQPMSTIDHSRGQYTHVQTVTTRESDNRTVSSLSLPSLMIFTPS